MKHSIVNFNKIELGNRIDSEYFDSYYLELENILRKKHSKKLSTYSKITASAFYPAATSLYSIGKIPFIRCVDCIDYPVISSKQKNSFEKIPKEFLEQNSNIRRIKESEVVITKVGTPCYASVISDIDFVALSRTVLGLHSIRNINPYYLVAFLRSKYGFDQLYRERELTIQYQLTLERTASILIYKPKNNLLEDLIAKCVKKSQRLRQTANHKYNKAERLLLKELNFHNWSPKRKLSFTSNFSNTQKKQRIDAEYYQPMYKNVVNAIKLKKYKSLGSLVSISKGVEPGNKAYQEKGIPFLRVSNLSKLGMNTNDQRYISASLYKQLKKYQPLKGEILLSKDATPGIALYLSKNVGKTIPSGGILRLTVNNSKTITPEYLTIVINSTLVQKQIERDAGGSIINHWLADQVKDTLIPILPIDEQKHISRLISESFKARRKSKKFLEIAKKSIETAIETNEKKATILIKRQSLC